MYALFHPAADVEACRGPFFLVVKVTTAGQKDVMATQGAEQHASELKFNKQKPGKSAAKIYDCVERRASAELVFLSFGTLSRRTNAALKPTSPQSQFRRLPFPTSHTDLLLVHDLEVHSTPQVILSIGIDYMHPRPRADAHGSTFS